MTDPTPTITVFVQTQMPGMNYGDIVTLAHTPYVDSLIAGGRLVADSDPIYQPLIDEQKAQPAAWNLLDTAVSAASPAVPVTPATAALSDTPPPNPSAPQPATGVETGGPATTTAPADTTATDPTATPAA